MAWNTATGSTMARKLLVAWLNTNTYASPTWSVMGVRVADSSMEYDTDPETIRDILGNIYTSQKAPVITQSFDPWELSGGDTALEAIWDDAVKNQNYTALANKDILVVHCFEGTADTAMFAERYPNSSVAVTSVGGEGGGNLSLAATVTYGGVRETGTAAIAGGVCTFTGA